MFVRTVALLVSTSSVDRRHSVDATCVGYELGQVDYIATGARRRILALCVARHVIPW